MSPSDLEEILARRPAVPLRLTLASGDQVTIANPDRTLMTGLTLYIGVSDDPDARMQQRVRIVSIPNINMIEPVETRPGGNGRRQ